MIEEYYEYNVQGHSISELARRFGTPLYVYDGDLLHEVYRALRERLHWGVDMFYSATANPNVSVCAVLRSLGAGIEVSSLAELVTAIRAGATPDNVIFLGPGKSTAELRACLDHGIHAVVCESLAELTALDALRPPAGTQVLLRVNPEFAGSGHQFGIDQEILRRSGPFLRSLRYAKVTGIHAYMGSRVVDAADIVRNTRGILTAARELSAELGFELRTVDIGGGLGVPYFDTEHGLDIDELTSGINAAAAEFLREHPDCRVITELGRYLVGWCGTYVVRARYVRESMGERLVITDGGADHHSGCPAPGGSGRCPIRSLTRHTAPADRQYSVAGPLTTPNDLLGTRVALPEVAPGDLLGVERSGAYGTTSSPDHLRGHGYPAEVLVLDGTAHLVRRRDTVDDLLGKQDLIDV